MLVVGAGGFSVQILNAIQRSDNHTNPVFFCDSHILPDSYISDRFRIIQSITEAQDYLNAEDARYCLGVGLKAKREEFCEMFEKLGGKLYSIVDPSAIVPLEVKESFQGVSCLAQSIVEPSASIGRGVLLNLGSMVTHHVQVGEFTELGPGAVLLGRCEIGNRTLVGSGSIVLPGVKVGDNVTIGAGSVVTKDLPKGVTAFGNPARIVAIS
jgi:sugar O-acyltransferase (sialic acid O-acetyltransferase NeuD family)